MEETKRIAELFEDLHNGELWIDVTLTGTLQHITAEKAAKKVSPNWNYIWEITNHLFRYRKIVLQRVQGNRVTAPANNFFEPVLDQSEKVWSATMNAFKKSEQE